MSKNPLIEALKNAWQLLSKGYKKVLKYIWWYFKKLKTVFPSHATIANDVGLSEKQVRNALNHFESKGWIGWVKRPYHSNVYFMPDEIINLNLNDEKEMSYLSQQNYRQNYRVLDVLSSYEDNTCTSGTPSATVPISSIKEQEQGLEEKKKWYSSLPEFLKKMFMWDRFDYKRFGWAIKSLSEQEIYELSNDFTWYHRQHKIDKPERFVMSRALTMIRGRKNV